MNYTRTVKLFTVLSLFISGHLKAEEISQQQPTPVPETAQQQQPIPETAQQQQPIPETTQQQQQQQQQQAVLYIPSERGQQQMKKVVIYAKNNHWGASNSDCFAAVWGYLTRSGYGKLNDWWDLPQMRSKYARYFSDYLNENENHLDEAGLVRIDNMIPEIKNPHDPRIPAGAVLVVAPGSYGTSHPEAGDIVVVAGNGRFINDGPNMYYGAQSTWYGKILGVYVPR